MNKQEAWRGLKDVLCCYFAEYFPSATYSEMETMIEQLKPPQPDPDTGLIPCGCKGRVDCNNLCIMDHEGNHLWVVECLKCGTSTYGHTTKEEAIDAWSRAMGCDND